MTTFPAVAVTTWVGGYDMTGDTNQTTLTLTRDALDSTTFTVGRVGRSRTAGLQDVQANVDGYTQFGTGTVDPAIIAALASTVPPVAHTPTGTEGDVSYFYQARELEYSLFGRVGELAPYSLGIQGAKGAGLSSVGAVRGRLLKAKGDVSATGATGTGIQLGAVGATQYLYAAFHVFTAGTTITVVLESDDNGSFSSATTRMTFGPITTAGGTWGTRVAGAITDDWYRFRITAITGTFTIGAEAGIK